MSLGNAKCACDECLAESLAKPELSMRVELNDLVASVETILDSIVEMQQSGPVGDGPEYLGELESIVGYADTQLRAALTLYQKAVAEKEKK